MNRKLIGALTGAIVVLCLIVRIVPGIVLGGLFDGAPTEWLPTFGTVGQTVVLYSYRVDILGALTPICLGVVFGYLLLRRRSLAGEFRPFVRTVALGAAIPAVLAWVVLIGVTLLSSFDPYPVALRTALVLNFLVTTSIPVFVSTVAGAALSRWFRDGVAPTPTGAETTPGETARDGTAPDETPTNERAAGVTASE